MLLALLIVLCSVEVASSEETWLGNYAGDRIPLRENLSSRYLVEYVTGGQAQLSERIFVVNMKLKAACQKEGGHALINMLQTVTVGDVLSTLETGVVYEKGVLVVLAADCVTRSRVVDPKSPSFP